MSAFEEARERLPGMISVLEGEEPLLWKFHRRLVFQRIITFLNRLRLITDCFEIAQQFNKLEKVVVAGIKGRDLTVKVEEIHSSFEKKFAHFSNVHYDVLNPEDDSFDKDYVLFKQKVEILDKRLAAIAVQAVDESYNLTSFFKVILIYIFV